MYDVVVIGGGPGGYTAALYTARAGLSTLVLEKLVAGGQMAQTGQIDNYPGFENGVDGFLLGMKMEQGAARFGVNTRRAEVRRVELKGDIKTVETDQETLSARTVIIATGAEHRHLGVEGEKELTGRGVSYCAACDGMFYRGKTVVVVGGGNSAAADALLLSRICQKVILVHRRDTLKATRVYHKNLADAMNVEFRWNSEVIGLLHGERLTGVRVRERNSGVVSEIACDGLFISIGRAPETELFRGQLELDSAGYLVADESTRTAIPGVFAAGDVRSKRVRQIVTAVGDGAVAAHYAEEYLSETCK